jgi:hypothetical protein
MTGRTRTRRGPLPKGRPRATAARQALRLCETGLPGPGGEAVGLPAAAWRHQSSHRSPAMTKAALRSAGVPPHIAALLCRRVRLQPEQEARP